MRSSGADVVAVAAGAGTDSEGGGEGGHLSSSGILGIFLGASARYLLIWAGEGGKIPHCFWRY